MANTQAPQLHRGVTSNKLKTGVFLVEGLNSVATTYFFYDVYFLTQKRFGFEARQNLLLAAAIGVVSVFSSFFGGRFAQKFGYFTSIQLGTALMAVTFLIGSQVEGLKGSLCLTLVAAGALCLTWPALEALTSEGEPAFRVRSLVGIYNFTWATGGALAYFTGGAMIQKWGLRSLFFVPAAMLLVELGLAFWLERKARDQPPTEFEHEVPLLRPMPDSAGSALPPKLFLKMALLANPLAYLAINTLISTIPSLAAHLHFTPTIAGFICSIWLFARAGTFVFLWLWPRWHYQFSYLAGSYIALIISFGAILLLQNLWVLVAAQIVFGMTIGLIYYSSLFYSMDSSETKGEHGGIHEAAISVGNAIGPGLAAAAIYCFPRIPGIGAMTVCVILIIGLGALLRLRGQSKTDEPFSAIHDPGHQIH